MSRRHKEKEEYRQTQQLKASQGDDPVTDRSDKGSASRFIGSAIHMKCLGAISSDVIIDKIIAVSKKLTTIAMELSFDDGLLQSCIDEAIRESKKRTNEAYSRSCGPGRPIIEQLCSCVKDSKVCQWAKGIFKKIYHRSIRLAKEVTQYLVCFLCSLFRIYNTSEADGRIAHFRRMMLPYVVNMPSDRNLQKYYRWFVNWRKAVIQTAKEKKDELKYRAWKKLEELIYDNLYPLTQQVAIA